MKRSRLVAGFILTAFLAVLIYPKKEVLIPAMEIKVRYEGGEIVSNGEVSRSWNHHLGSGWTASIARTDSSGVVTFPAIAKRVPMIVNALSVVGSIPGHYYPGLAGSIKARDSYNNFIWQRLDFNDRNCCPKEIVIGLHEEKGEAENSYFTFGKIVPNE